MELSSHDKRLIAEHKLKGNSCETCYHYAAGHDECLINWDDVFPDYDFNPIPKERICRWYHAFNN